MHSYLKALGFKEKLSKKGISLLADALLDKSKVSLDKVDKTYEIKTYLGDSFGIVWYGTFDNNLKFEVEYYIPFVDGKHSTVAENLTVEERKDYEVYMGMCDNNNFGVSLIFQFVNNQAVFERENEDKSLFKDEVCFSALSNNAMIILPLITKEPQKEKDEDDYRMELTSAARKGDEQAMEILTLEEMDTYSSLNKRIKKEDLFTIVKSTFMPSGLESDVYNVIGDIEYVKVDYNKVNRKKVYEMLVNCSGLRFTVAIAEDNLEGEPVVGRRFKGTIWLQGHYKKAVV